MIPLKLSINGFLSYQELVEVDFQSFDLACISGPNGAGKSSILDALTWALFGIARQRDDSLINAQSDFAEVTLVFAYESNSFLVQRSKSRNKTSQLEFHILQSGDLAGGQDISWKPLTERTMRDTQARIHETLRLDYETFVNASFFLQGKADQFTQQRPGDRKRILGTILGLEVWEQYRQQTRERRRAIEIEIKNLEGRIQEIDNELAEETARKAHLEKIQTDLDQLEKARQASEDSLETIRQIMTTLQSQREFLASLARQIKTAEEGRANQATRLSSRQAEREELADALEKADEIEAAYQAWQQAREDLARWDETASRFREQENRRTAPLMEIQEARARLETEVAALHETRRQIHQSHERLASGEAALKESEQHLAAVQNRVAERGKVETDLQDVRVEIAGLKTENQAMKSDMETLKDRIDQLEDAEGAVCPLCGQPLTPPDRQSLIDQLNTEGTAMGNRYRGNKEQLEEVQSKLSSLEIDLAGFEGVDAELQRKTEKISQQKAQLEALEREIAAWNETSAPRLAEVEKALQEEDYAPEAHTQLAEIDAELKTIGYDAAAHDAVRKAEQAGRAQEASYRDLERARATLAPLEREIADLLAQDEEQQREIARLQAEYETASSALEEAEARAPDLKTAEAEHFRLQEEENRLRMEVGAARQKVTVLGDLKERRNALSSEREAYFEQVASHRQLERAFGKDGVPALLIEQALPQIEAKANEILDRLSGGAMSVRFQTQAAYKDSKRDDLKETLDIQISDSAGSRDYEMYSGGEAFRVNFAVRLALSEVLAQRAGARLQTLVIDEGFGSQDAAGRQRLIEAINLVRTDFAKILVITHIDEMKEAFPNRIEVEKTDRGSRINIL
ncbi:MAG: SMC family ATPase [Anaerolineales bacterium]|nr:SMC family ATPase [Anaerolineales bacterium]